MFRIPPAAASAGFQVLGLAAATADGVSARIDAFTGGTSIRGLLENAAPQLAMGVERVLGGLSGLQRQIQTSRPYLSAYFSQFPELFKTPSGERLLELALRPATQGPDGFPLIEESVFRSFVDGVPHLFSRGGEVLRWVEVLRRSVEKPRGLSSATVTSIRRAAEAFHTLANTAAVTAPPDLWLMRQILATHARSGLLDLLDQRREVITREDAELLDLEPEQLSFDLQFLWTRGVLERFADGYAKSPTLPYRLDRRLDLPDEFRTDMAGELSVWLGGQRGPERESLLRRWLTLPAESQRTADWTASRRDLEIGYRLLPAVLALKASGLLQGLRAGDEFPDDRVLPGLRNLLVAAGLVAGSRVTTLGARVFERGPGVYGIIGAYHPYLNRHADLLSASGARPSVERGRNIAASRDANRKSFKDAVQILWDYARATDTRYCIVIEHAMGLCVGVQEFRRKFGDEGVRYFGADFEDAAIEGAKRELEARRLPPGMKFLQADIAKPAPLVEFLRANDALGDSSGGSTVMIVGNGFHEARGKSDDEMISVLRQYREAGITIAFSEESGLTDRQIRDSGWNSYHAGFRWTHQVSGQRLRTPWPMDPPTERLSWTEVFERAGYRVPREFRRGTRPVFPCDLPGERNPPISVTFLCLPS
ncbi:MAG TPA: hypothetical protein VLJ37_10915 [bacterium]|nr:hypothetical protein [bacterium]